MSEALVRSLSEKRDRLHAEEASVAREVAKAKDNLKEAESALAAVQNRIADLTADIAKAETE